MIAIVRYGGWLVCRRGNVDFISHRHAAHHHHGPRPPLFCKVPGSFLHNCSPAIACFCTWGQGGWCSALAGVTGTAVRTCAEPMRMQDSWRAAAEEEHVTRSRVPSCERPRSPSAKLSTRSVYRKDSTWKPLGSHLLKPLLHQKLPIEKAPADTAKHCEHSPALSRQRCVPCPLHHMKQEGCYTYLYKSRAKPSSSSYQSPLYLNWAVLLTACWLPRQCPRPGAQYTKAPDHAGSSCDGG